VLSIDGGAQADVTGRIRVLSRVRQQVGQNLRQAKRVCREDDRLGGQLDREAMSLCIDERSGSLDGRVHDGHEFRHFRA
jgi:hypothetical protein